MIGATYMGFGPRDEEELARAEFLKRYGRDPAEIVRTGGALLVGPVEEALPVEQVQQEAEQA